MSNIIALKNLNTLPEFFLGISIIYMTCHSAILSVQKKKIIITDSIMYLNILILSCVFYLLLNDGSIIGSVSCFNNTIISDSLSFYSKFLLTFYAIMCLLIIRQYLNRQNLNNFEYPLLFMFSILGLMLLISSNDLITAYLSIELQSLSFYIMASINKNSTFSVEAGLKYFILGSFASCFFLLGTSIIYGLLGTCSLENIKDLLTLSSENTELQSFFFAIHETAFT